ncbi:AAA family ATPase [Embleya sp. NPDC050154]|uniref:AAA family ATPase n=1 Tax=Embleya sp. NPDC050154 TaxID=3363988 RepID=UPI00378BC431
MPDDDNLRKISKLLADVNHSATTVTKYRMFEQFLSDLIGVAPGRIYTVYVSKPGNLSVRVEQSGRARDAELVVALIPRDSDATAVANAARRQTEKNGQAIVLLRQLSEDSHGTQWAVGEAFSPNEAEAQRSLRQLREELGGPSPEVVATQVRRHIEQSQILLPTEQVRLTPGFPPEITERSPDPIAVPAIRVDARTRRMLESAIASHRAVMLVGPPGTGKSSLVRELVRSTEDDPGRFGMQLSHELTTVTADESWTTRELIGGDSVDDDGNLRFTPGHVLQAIEQDKWLLLDEANRADMDRIFGSLLTWLSGELGESVTVGRLSPTNTTAVVLGWTEEAGSRTLDLDVSTDPKKQDKRKVGYLAGSEWRLIGTYNSLDAQRVFRFGLALGRRFAQVPVPAPTAELFAEVLAEHSDGFGLPEDRAEEVLALIERIYGVHRGNPATAIGPALFLSVPRSIAAALRADPDGDLDEFLAEAYLLCFGPWLARLDDEALATLEESFEAQNVLHTQWAWIRDQLQCLG